MSVTATGSPGTQLMLLVTHLSNSAVWQEECGAPSAAQALRYIYWPWGDFQELPRPFIIVKPSPINYVRASGGASTLLLPEGDFKLLIARDNNEALTPHDNWISFDNLVNGIIENLLAINGVSSNLNISELTTDEYKVSDPTTVAAGADAESNPNYWLSESLLHWRTI